MKQFFYSPLGLMIDHYSKAWLFMSINLFSEIFRHDVVYFDPDIGYLLGKADVIEVHKEWLLEISSFQIPKVRISHQLLFVDKDQSLFVSKFELNTHCDELLLQFHIHQTREAITYIALIKDYLSPVLSRYKPRNDDANQLDLDFAA